MSETVLFAVRRVRRVILDYIHPAGFTVENVVWEEDLHRLDLPGCVPIDMPVVICFGPGQDVMGAGVYAAVLLLPFAEDAAPTPDRLALQMPGLLDVAGAIRGLESALTEAPHPEVSRLLSELLASPLYAWEWTGSIPADRGPDGIPHPSRLRPISIRYAPPPVRLLDDLLTAAETPGNRTSQTGSSAWASRLQINGPTLTVTLDDTRYHVDHPGVFAAYTALAKAQGNLVETQQLNELPGCKGRLDKLLREHLPPELRQTVKSQGGHNGGYWLCLPQEE